MAKSLNGYRKAREGPKLNVEKLRGGGGKNVPEVTKVVLNNGGEREEGGAWKLRPDENEGATSGSVRQWTKVAKVLRQKTKGTRKRGPSLREKET